MVCAGSGGQDEKDGEQLGLGPGHQVRAAWESGGDGPRLHGSWRGEKVERTTLKDSPEQLCSTGEQRNWAVGKREAG